MNNNNNTFKVVYAFCDGGFMPSIQALDWLDKNDFVNELPFRISERYIDIDKPHWV